MGGGYSAECFEWRVNLFSSLMSMHGSKKLASSVNGQSSEGQMFSTVLPKVTILRLYDESRIYDSSGEVDRKPDVGHQCNPVRDGNFYTYKLINLHNSPS